MASRKTASCFRSEILLKLITRAVCLQKFHTVGGNFKTRAPAYKP